MNAANLYAIAALVGLIGFITGCLLGYAAGNRAGISAGYECCRLRYTMRERARRDPITGRWRKVKETK